MPTTCFTEEEIVDSGIAIVNSRGAAYIAQKHIGETIRWFIVKKE